jgi:hypothetical protein
MLIRIAIGRLKKAPDDPALLLCHQPDAVSWRLCG